MMRTMDKIRRSPRRRLVRSENACPACGGETRERKGTLKLPVNGEEISVPDSAHLRCLRCREVILRFDDARRLRQQALEIYRRRYGLLSADDMRSIRKRVGLTQAMMAHLLRLGSNTISRWEAGRNVQTGAMDLLLRMIRDVPGTLEYLKKRPA
jgi:putative zinc finger/helix-turn-helix YgiT family protein